jgi:TRAP-type mannitol/chloroaromatic compound transport system permease small subunit
MSYIVGACIGVIVWVIVLCLSVLVRKFVKFIARIFKVNERWILFGLVFAVAGALYYAS